MMSRLPRGPRRRTVPVEPTVQRLIRGVLVVGSIGLALHLVLPQIPGIERSLRLVAGTSHLLVGAAFLAELASEMCYAELLGRSVAAMNTRKPGRWFMLRLTVTGYGAAHVLPGGGAAAATVTYGALRRRGFQPAGVGLALTVVSVLVYGVLGILFAALGVVADPLVLLVAYGVATALAAIPLTPGGIGAFEVVMLTTLALLGVGSEAAGIVLGVATAAGFAGLETMGYGFVSLLASRGNLGVLDEVLLVRGLTSPRDTWPGRDSCARFCGARDSRGGTRSWTGGWAAPS